MRTVRLSEFCDIVGGGRRKWTGSDFVADGFPSFGAGGINGYLPEAEFDRPAIVLSSIGARCGKCFIAEGKWSSLANTQLIFPDTERAEPRFLWYQLNDESRWPRSGTAQPFIKPSDVKAHRVFLPPIEEQRRIAAVLDAADALRVKRRQALAKLDTLTQAIFIDMFGETAPGASKWPEIELSGAVAEGTTITYGIVQAGEEFAGGVPYIRTGDIVDGKIRSDSLRHTRPQIADGFPRSRVRPSEIVMSIRATVGTTALVPEELDGANLTQGTARIAPGEKFEPTFLLEFLRSPSSQQWIQRQVKGATFREITLTRLRELPVSLPPRRLQHEFRIRCEAVNALRASGQIGLEQADTLFASLQQRAFRGEL